MLEEVEFHRLSKLRLEVDEPEELYVTFAFAFIGAYCVAAVHTVVCLHTTSRLTESRPRRRGHSNWSIASSTTLRRRTIR